MIAQPSKKLNYLFTSESVSEGHPDKVADQISDTVLDNLLAWDPSSKVACETLVTTGQVVLAGEITTKADVELREAVRATFDKLAPNGGFIYAALAMGKIKGSEKPKMDIVMDVYMKYARNWYQTH